MERRDPSTATARAHGAGGKAVPDELMVSWLVRASRCVIEKKRQQAKSEAINSTEAA